MWKFWRGAAALLALLGILTQSQAANVVETRKIIATLNGAPLHKLLDLNFAANPVLDPRITFTRAAGTASYFDATGTLQTAGTNVARFTYDPATLAPKGFMLESARTNSVRNSVAAGAVAATPGTVPTNWTAGSTANGITRTIAVGTENGLAYAEYSYIGTPTSTSNLTGTFESSTQITASNTQTWSCSAFARVVSAVGNTSQSIRIIEADSGGAFLGGGTAVTIVSGTNLGSSRQVVTRTFNQATAAFAQCQWIFGYTINVPLNLVVRFAGPQVELGASVTSYIPTSGAAATRAVEAASMTLASFNAVGKLSDATVYAKIIINGFNGGNQSIATISDGTTNNRYFFFHNSTSFTIASALAGTLGTTAGATDSIAAGSPSSGAATWRASGTRVQVAANGGTAAGGTFSQIPAVSSLTTLNIGNSGAGASLLDGELQRLIIYAPPAIQDRAGILQQLSAGP
jgi:hypothetical protein